MLRRPIAEHQRVGRVLQRLAAQKLQHLLGASSICRPPLAPQRCLLSSQDGSAATGSGWRVSTVTRGLTVASVDRGGPLSSVGLFVSGGMHHENKDTAGASRILDGLGFGIFGNSEAEVEDVIDSLACTPRFTSSRESTGYVVEGMRNGISVFVPMLTGLLDDHRRIMRRAAARVDELKLESDGVTEGAADTAAPVADEVVVEECLQNAAWGREIPRLPGTSNSAALDKFLNERFQSGKSIIVGVDVAHDELCRLATASLELGDEYNRREQADTALVSAPSQRWRRPWQLGRAAKTQKRPFVGGDCRIEQVTEESGLVQVVLALEVPGGWSKMKNVLVAAVLQTLLGGGGSFSAGGPGKGLKSRLYTDVLCADRWIQSCHALTIQYETSGLIGIHYVGDASRGREMVQSMCSQFKRLGTVGDWELTRAKNALKSSIAMNLEHRAILTEDAARQLLAVGGSAAVVQGVEEFDRLIDQVTEADIQRFVGAVLKGQERAAVVAVGRCDSVPDRQTILRMLRN